LSKSRDLTTLVAQRQVLPSDDLETDEPDRELAAERYWIEAGTVFAILPS
jgi:hypothetical protein